MKMFYEEAERFFSMLFGGRHHIPSPGIRQWGNDDGWYVNTISDLSTFDGNLLTRLVILAHDECIRATIEPCNMQRVRIIIWKREGRTGRFDTRHPTIEWAIEDFRS